MAVLTLAINTKDNSSSAIQNISNSFSKLRNVVETARNSIKSISGGFLNLTAGVGGIITIINSVVRIFKKLDDTFKRIGGEAAQSWNELKAVFGVIGKIVADMIVPAITSMSKGLTSFIKSADGLKFISTIAGTIAAGFTILKNVFEVLYNIIKDSVLKAFSDIKSRMEQTSSSSDMLTGGLNILKGVVTALSVVFSINVNIIKMLIIAIMDLVEISKAAGELLGNIFTGQWDKVGESAKKVSEKFKNLTINLKDNFKDIISGAIETAASVDKNFDVKKIATETIKAFNDTKKNVETSLKSINTSFTDTNDNLKEDSLIFTEELKKAYIEYVNLKKDLTERNYKNEQEYFDKLARLQELSKIKGIKELEDYYKQSEKIIEKGQENLLSKASKLLEGLDFNKYFVEIDNNLSKLTNSIMTSLNTLAVSVIKSFSNIKDELEKINNSNLSDTEKMVEKMKTLFNAIGTSISATFQAIGQIINASFGFYNSQIETEIKSIEAKYSELFSKLDKQKEQELANIEEYINNQLEQIGEGAKSELEIAEEKLNQLRELQQSFRDEETEQRLQALDDYYNTLDNQTDADIQAAYERQRAKILEVEEKKRLDLEEQISAQQKEVAKLKIMEEANKKKAEIEANYEKKKLEAERQRQNELNEAEKKAFEANKANQIANLWISTAMGIATAWATSMQLGPIAGPIMGGILSTLLLTNAGIQTGLIASQQYTPKNFATGGIVVGEAGRELVELPKGSRVYNNDQTERLLEGQEVTIVNNIFLDSVKIEEILIKKRLAGALR